MTEPKLPKGKVPKVDFTCARCTNTSYIDRTGYDHLNRVLNIRVCKKCGTNHLKEQEQFVMIPANLYVRIR